VWRRHRPPRFSALSGGGIPVRQVAVGPPKDGLGAGRTGRGRNVVLPWQACLGRHRGLAVDLAPTVRSPAEMSRGAASAERDGGDRHAGVVDEQADGHRHGEPMSPARRVLTCFQKGPTGCASHEPGRSRT